MSVRNIARPALAVVLLTMCSIANAQIVIGPITQEVPIFGAPLLITLGGFLAFIAYKFGLVKNTKKGLFGLLIIGGASLIGVNGGLNFISGVEAGTTLTSVNGTNNTSYPIVDGQPNGYQNNTGITLEIKSITLPGACDADTAPDTRCTVGLEIAPMGICAINCASN